MESESESESESEYGSSLLRLLFNLVIFEVLLLEVLLLEVLLLVHKPCFSHNLTSRDLKRFRRSSVLSITPDFVEYLS